MRICNVQEKTGCSGLPEVNTFKTKPTLREAMILQLTEATEILNIFCALGKRAKKLLSKTSKNDQKTLIADYEQKITASVYQGNLSERLHYN